jgi:hypothetical protein
MLLLGVIELLLRTTRKVSLGDYPRLIFWFEFVHLHVRNAVAIRHGANRVRLCIKYGAVQAVIERLIFGVMFSDSCWLSGAQMKVNAVVVRQADTGLG